MSFGETYWKMRSRIKELSKKDIEPSDYPGEGVRDSSGVWIDGGGEGGEDSGCSGDRRVAISCGDKHGFL